VVVDPKGGESLAGASAGETKTAQPSLAVDGIGLPLSDHLIVLEKSHDKFLAYSGTEASHDMEAAMAHYTLAAHSVAHILRAGGRAQYGPDGEDGQFHLQPSDTHWSFGYSGANFRFAKGEFPAFDLAQTRLAAIHEGRTVQPLSAVELELFENCYQQAARELEREIAQ
jgi:hypothetical protein